MISKSWLVAVVALALPSLALAGEKEAKVDWTIGAAPEAAAAPAPRAASAPVIRASTGNISQKEMQVVAEAAKAKAQKEAFKQTEVPGSQSGGGSHASKGPQLPIVGNARMKAIGSAMKAKASKNAGRPIDLPTARSDGGGRGGAPAMNDRMKVVASAMKVRSEKNANGRPSQDLKAPAAPSSGQGWGFGSHSSGFGGRLSGVEARSPFARSSPGERATHCNARGMCF